MPVNVQNLCKAFGDNQVLKHWNMRLEDGRSYCLMAPSGAGKTTLLRILMGLETKDSGTVDGIETQEVSVMFQENRLCETLNAVDNVLLVCPPHTDKKTVTKNLGEILPKECLRQPVSELSGGMKRRVALARAMSYPGKFVILDEPFTGLDRETKKEVVRYILRMQKGRILLVATHGEEDVALLGAEKIVLE